VHRRNIGTRSKGRKEGDPIKNKRGLEKTLKGLGRMDRGIILRGGGGGGRLENISKV